MKWKCLLNKKERRCGSRMGKNTSNLKQGLKAFLIFNSRPIEREEERESWQRKLTEEGEGPSCRRGWWEGSRGSFYSDQRRWIIREGENLTSKWRKGKRPKTWGIQGHQTRGHINEVMRFLVARPSVEFLVRKGT